MIKELFCRLLPKIMSGRYFVVVAIISTYCFVIVKTIDLVMAGKITLDVFLGLFSGFSSLAGTIVYAYFNRPDRNGSQNPDELMRDNKKGGAV